MEKKGGERETQRERETCSSRPTQPASLFFVFLFVLAKGGPEFNLHVLGRRLSMRTIAKTHSTVCPLAHQMSDENTQPTSLGVNLVTGCSKDFFSSTILAPAPGALTLSK